MMIYETIKVEYHSSEWEKLVESGWLTWTVEDDIATMLHQI